MTPEINPVSRATMYSKLQDTRANTSAVTDTFRLHSRNAGQNTRLCDNIRQRLQPLIEWLASIGTSVDADFYFAHCSL